MVENPILAISSTALPILMSQNPEKVKVRGGGATWGLMKMRNLRKISAQFVKVLFGYSANRKFVLQTHLYLFNVFPKYFFQKTFQSPFSIKTTCILIMYKGKFGRQPIFAFPHWVWTFFYINFWDTLFAKKRAEFKYTWVLYFILTLKWWRHNEFY